MILTYFAVSGVCCAAVLVATACGIHWIQIAVRLPVAVAISWAFS